MNAWQKRFAEKMEVVREVSRGRFSELTEKLLEPIFEEFKVFTYEQGIQSSTPVVTAGFQTFKFAMTENTFLLLTFRLDGLEHCETLAEYFVPKEKKLAPIGETIELVDANADWVRRTFEQGLERFVDACMRTFAENKNRAAQPVSV